MKIAVDMGHCLKGWDTSADGRSSGGFLESEYDRILGAKVIELFQSEGHEVVNVTVDDGSSYTSMYGSLGTRVTKANNAGVDLYLSIHFNATPGGKGTEVYLAPYGYYGSDSSYNTNLAYATRVQNNMANLGFANRGVKQEEYYVLVNSNAHAILIETCFCDSASDKALYDSLGVDTIARAIVGGILDKTLITSSAPVSTNSFDNVDQSLYSPQVGNVRGMKIVLSNAAKQGNGAGSTKGEGFPATWKYPNELTVTDVVIIDGSLEVKVNNTYVPVFDNYLKIVNNTKINFPIRLDDKNVEFSEKYYLKENADVAAAVSRGEYFSGYHHYLLCGKKENRKHILTKPSDWSDEVYLELNPDVKAVGYTSGWSHYCAYGFDEGRAYKKEEIKAEIVQDVVSDTSVKYQIIAGSFSSKENAEKQIALLKEKGVEAYIKLKE